MASSSSGQVRAPGTRASKASYVRVGRAVVLKGKLSNEGLVELDSALDAAAERWKEHVLEIAADRFECRLAQEISATRIEIAASRLSIIRWVAGLLIAHAGVIIGTVFVMMTFLVNALKP